MQLAVSLSSGCSVRRAISEPAYLRAMCRVSPSQKSAAEDWGDASLIYSDMSSMQSRPFDMDGSSLTGDLLVLPSITAMKFSVTTMPSSGSTVRLLGVILCSFISICYVVTGMFDGPMTGFERGIVP